MTPILLYKSETIGALALALSKAQGEIKGAAKDATNPHLHNRYADLSSCWEACREPLARNELAVTQMPNVLDDEDRTEVLDTLLMHSSGEFMGCRIRLIYSREEKALKPMQTMGSAITYARRYGLCAVVGIAPEDDDGESAGGQRQPGSARASRPQANGEHRGPAGSIPTNGKAFYAWLKDREQETPGAWKSIDAWARRHNLPNRIVEWTPEMVRDALAEFERGRGPAPAPAPAPDGSATATGSGWWGAYLARLGGTLPMPRNDFLSAVYDLAIAQPGLYGEAEVLPQGADDDELLRELTKAASRDPALLDHLADRVLAGSAAVPAAV